MPGRKSRRPRHSRTRERPGGQLPGSLTVPMGSRADAERLGDGPDLRGVQALARASSSPQRTMWSDHMSTWTDVAGACDDPQDGRSAGAGCGTRRPCCTPISTPSTPRSSSATRPRCAAGPSSSAAAWCWRRATRRRPVGCAPRWAAGRRATCARMPWSSRRGWMPTPRPAKTCSRSSAIRRRSWRGSPSTRRFWRSVVSGASRARPSRSRCDCVSGFVRRSDWPSRSGSRGPSSSPRSPARSASPMGCSWSSPTGRRRSCSRCRSNGCGVSVP